MTRMILTDAQSALMELNCLGKSADPGRTGGNGRMFLEAVLWIARTGAPSATSRADPRLRDGDGFYKFGICSKLSSHDPSAALAQYTPLSTQPNI